MTEYSKSALSDALYLIDCVLRSEGEEGLRYESKEAGWRHKLESSYKAPPSKDAIAEARVWLHRALWRIEREKRDEL